MLLSLPALSEKIPYVHESSGNYKLLLRFALGMLHCGMIQEQDVQHLVPSELRLSDLCKLIEKGWQRELGSSTDYRVLSACTRLVLPRHDNAQFQDDKGVPKAGFLVGAMHPPSIAVGKVFSGIEALQADLGQSALQILEIALNRFSFPFTPEGAFLIAQRLYWQWEEDETVAIEEAIESGESAEDIDIPRRAIIFCDVPEWAYKGQSRKIEDREFKAAARRFAKTKYGKLLKALEKLMQFESSSNLFVERCVDNYGDTAETCSPPILLGWNEEDDFMQIFDDFYQYEMQAGENSEWAGVEYFDPSAEGISAALPIIRNTCASIQALNQCVVEIRNLNEESRNLQ
jgi:PRTRC genetic system protein F